MRIILATVHMDEPKGTPHMHILVQPIGEGYKQGFGTSKVREGCRI